MPNQQSQLSSVSTVTPPKRLRAPALRDKALLLIEKHGYWTTTDGDIRVRRAKLGQFCFLLVSRFGGGTKILKLPSDYNYYRALNGRPLVSEPDFLLDIGHGAYKVASFEWQEYGPVEWRTFKSGAWEAELLKFEPDDSASAIVPIVPNGQSCKARNP